MSDVALTFHGLVCPTENVLKAGQGNAGYAVSVEVTGP